LSVDAEIDNLCRKPLYFSPNNLFAVKIDAFGRLIVKDVVVESRNTTPTRIIEIIVNFPKGLPITRAQITRIEMKTDANDSRCKSQVLSKSQVTNANGSGENRFDAFFIMALRKFAGIAEFSDLPNNPWILGWLVRKNIKRGCTN
jgi:hypothetical protein